MCSSLKLNYILLVIILVVFIVIVIYSYCWDALYNSILYLLLFSWVFSFSFKYIWIILFELNCQDFHYNKLLYYLLDFFFLACNKIFSVTFPTHLHKVLLETSWSVQPCFQLLLCRSKRPSCAPNLLALLDCFWSLGVK